MKKLSILIPALLLFTAGNALAQVDTDADVVTVSANVLTAIDITTITNVDFGDISIGSSPIIRANANDNAGTHQDVDTPTAGQVDITGDSESGVFIELTQMAVLENGTADQLSFTPSIYFGSIDLELTALNDTATLTLPGGGGSQTASLDVGGSLASPTVSGTYTTGTGAGAPLELTVNYDI